MLTPKIQINGGSGTSDNQFAVDLTITVGGTVTLTDSTVGGTPQQRKWTFEGYPGPLGSAPVFSPNDTAGSVTFAAATDGAHIVSMIRKDAGVWTKAYAVVGMQNANGLVFPCPGLSGRLLQAVNAAAIKAGWAGSAEGTDNVFLDAILRFMYAAAIVGVPASRQIIAGAGLTGGGDFSANRTIDVVAGDATIVVGSNTIQVGVISEAQVTNLISDLSALSSAIALRALASIILTAGAGLTGGGDLTTNRTFNVVAADGTIVVNADSIQVGTIAESQVTNLISDLAAKVPNTRQVIAGAGLTGGGALSGDITINVIANVDGSIVVAPDDIKVGVLATDAQHGNRGGGALHPNATQSVAGFMSSSDKTRLDTLSYQKEMGALNLSNTNATRYIAPGYNNNTASANSLDMPVSVAFTITEIRMNTRVIGAAGATMTGTVRKNGAAVAAASLTVASDAASGSASLGGNSVAFAPGDTWGFQVSKSAGVTSPTDIWWVVKLQQ